jgi:RNA polymerase sigma-70 factor, ECF subfamily
MTDATATEDSDTRLMLRFKEGDREAFELLFSRHTRAMINFAYRFVRNREVAEELAQEIFMRIYEGAGGYQAQARFTTWLYRIATHVCLNEIRKPRYRATHAPLEEAIPIGRDAQTGERLEREAVSLAIRSALDQLPEKQRTAFILNKYQELSYEEVSEVMKISDKAVKSLIHRAKETLAGRLKPFLSGLVNI